MVTRSNWFRSLNTDQTFYENVKITGAGQTKGIILAQYDYEGIVIKKGIRVSFSRYILLFLPADTGLHLLIWRLQSRFLSLKGKSGYILKFAVTASPYDGAML